MSKRRESGPSLRNGPPGYPRVVKHSGQPACLMGHPLADWRGDGSDLEVRLEVLQHQCGLVLVQLGDEGLTNLAQQRSRRRVFKRELHLRGSAYGLEAKDDRALQIAGHPSHDALLGHVLDILTLTFQV